MGSRSQKTSSTGARSARPAREGAPGSRNLAGRNGAWLADRPTDGDTDSGAARAPAGGVHGSRAGNAKVAKSVEEQKAVSPRRAYGLALKALGAANPRIVALDGDVKYSTYAEDFAKAYPERYFEGRIAAQNMVSAGAGLAAAGKIAFVSTFGRFMERAFDEIEMAIIGGLPIKLVGTHSRYHPRRRWAEPDGTGGCGIHAHARPYG